MIPCAVANLFPSSPFQTIHRAERQFIGSKQFSGGWTRGRSDIYTDGGYLVQLVTKQQGVVTVLHVQHRHVRLASLELNREYIVLEIR